MMMPDRRNSFFRRMAMFVRHPQLEWSDTALPLDESDLERLRVQSDLAKRTALDNEDKRAELGSLRRRLKSHRDEGAGRESRNGRSSYNGASRGSVGGVRGRSSSQQSANGSGQSQGGLLGRIVRPGEAREARRPPKVDKQRTERRLFMSTQPGSVGDSRQPKVVVQPVPEALKMLRFVDTDVLPDRPVFEDEKALPAGYQVEHESSAMRVQTLASGVSAITDAALCLASDDFAKARAVLLEALEKPSDDAPLLVRAWLEMLNAAGMKDRYEADAKALAERFKVRTPAYRDVSSTGRSAPRFTSRRNLTTADAHLLGRLIMSAGETTEPLVLNFLKLESIEEGAYASLALALKKLNRFGRPFVLTGGLRLVDAMAAHFDRTAGKLSHHAYDARLEILRLMNQPLAYAEVAEEYARRYPLPVPDWGPPTAQFKTYLDTPLPPDQQLALADAPTADEPKREVAELKLSGNLTRDNIDDTIAYLESQSNEYRIVNIDCGDLLRIDFESAVSLLNWLERCKERSQKVSLSELGVLNEALLHTVGVDPTSVSLLRRVV
jgi:ABC-type transporter Mla MlaB component